MDAKTKANLWLPIYLISIWLGINFEQLINRLVIILRFFVKSQFYFLLKIFEEGIFTRLAFLALLTYLDTI